MERVISHVVGAATNAAALFAADAITDAVDTTWLAGLGAAALIELMYSAYSAAVFRLMRASTEDDRLGMSCLAVILMFAGVIVPLPITVFVAAVVPGLEISGFWAAILVFVCLWAVQGLFAGVWALTRPAQRRLRRQSAGPCG